jgi:hypothetical protein
VRWPFGSSSSRCSASPFWNWLTEGGLLLLVYAVKSTPAHFFLCRLVQDVEVGFLNPLYVISPQIRSPGLGLDSPSCSTSFRSPLHSANCNYELLLYPSLSMSVNLQFSLQSCLSLTAPIHWPTRLTITSVNTTVLGF